MGIIRNGDKTENSKNTQNNKIHCSVHTAGEKRKGESKDTQQVSGSKDFTNKNVTEKTTGIMAVKERHQCRNELLLLTMWFVYKVYELGKRFIGTTDSPDKNVNKKGTKEVTVVEDEYRYNNMEEEFHDMAQKYYYLYEIIVIAKEINSVQKYQDVIFEWEYTIRQLGSKHTVERWNGLNRKYFNNDWFGDIDANASSPKSSIERLGGFMNEWYTTITRLGIKRYNEKSLTITSPADKYKFYNIDNRKIGDTVEILHSFWYVEDEHGIRIIAKGTATE